METKITLRSLILAAAVVALCSTVFADWNQGLAEFNAGNFQEAAEHFAEITRTNPTWPGGFYMLGRCQSEIGLGTEAIENLQKAYDLKPSDTDTVIALSQELMTEGDFAQTRELLETVDSKTMPPALRSLASILMASAMLEEGDADTAVAFLHDKIADDTENPALFQILGKAQAESDDLQGAFQSYSTAFALDSKESSALAATTTALAIAGAATDTDVKIQWCLQALEIGSRMAMSSPDAHNDLMVGEAARGAEDLEAAESWFRAAVSKDEDDPQAWYLLGRTLADLGRETEAYEAFSTALNFASDEGLIHRIHGRMGQIAACRFDLQTAASHYRSALKDDRARQIDELASLFADALAQREKHNSTVREIQQMELELEDLGDAQGVTAMRERAAAELAKIAEIEDNLQAVRSALCR